jgi:DNA-binding MarR family transcriptional regulator
MLEHSSERVDECLIALRRILRAITLFDRELAQSANLTPAQLRVLQILDFKSDGSTTPKALARQMGIAQATVTAIIDKLEALQLISRQRSDADRRQTNVVITDQGKERVHSAPDALQQRFVRAFDQMHDWEQAQLVASLERVATMLDADAIDASPVLTANAIDTP